MLVQLDARARAARGRAYVRAGPLAGALGARARASEGECARVCVCVYASACVRARERASVRACVHVCLPEAAPKNTENSVSKD